MKSEFRLGKIAGISLTAVPSALAGLLLLWLIFTGVARVALRLPLPSAAGFGLLAVLGHWISEIWHQLGHALAARQAGYPMEGIRLWGMLSTSIYPPDEPALPAAIHIRRALGGPLASLAFTFLAALVALLLRSTPGLAFYLAGLLAIENLSLFTLGALIPLGFTDGSTLLAWWGKS